MQRQLLILLALVLLSAPGQLALAQDAPPALTVRLRDSAGAGIAGVAVTVTDISGRTMLARQTSDSAGIARFATLPLPDVRVRVEGRLADGTALLLPGQDAAGIAVVLGTPTTLELRSEADGTVLPDPELELSLEVGVDLTPATAVEPMPAPFGPIAPTSAAAAAAPSPSAQLAGVSLTNPTATSPLNAATPTTAQSGLIWPGVLLLALLLTALLIVVASQQRWRKQ